MQPSMTDVEAGVFSTELLSRFQKGVDKSCCQTWNKIMQVRVFSRINLFMNRQCWDLVCPRVKVERLWHCSFKSTNPMHLHTEEPYKW